jgi:hypothetical protein
LVFTASAKCWAAVPTEDPIGSGIDSFTSTLLAPAAEAPAEQPLRARVATEAAARTASQPSRLVMGIFPFVFEKGVL